MQASNAHKVSLEIHSRQNFVFIVVFRKTLLSQSKLYEMEYIVYYPASKPTASHPDLTISYHPLSYPMRLLDLSEIFRRSLGDLSEVLGPY